MQSAGDSQEPRNQRHMQTASRCTIAATDQTSFAKDPTSRYETRWKPQTAATNSIRGDRPSQHSERNQTTCPTGFSPPSKGNSAIRAVKAPTMTRNGRKHSAADSFGCFIQFVVILTESR